MAYSNVGITPGAGANIAVDLVGSLNLQVIKMDAGVSGSSYPVVNDGVHTGLPVYATSVQGNVSVTPASGATFPVSAASAIPVSASSALPVSAPANSPVAVQLSNGSAAISTLPVSGTVTAGQGTAAAISGAWPIAITDGSAHQAPLDSSNGYALKVSVVATPGAGAVADESAFTAGTTDLDIVGGVYNDSLATPSSGQAAAFRMTQNRALHINLRNSSGTEIGLSGSPVYVQPTGSGTQPVSGTVTASLSTSTNAGAAANTENYNTGSGSADTVTMFGIALPANGGAVAGGTATNPVRIDPVGTTTQPVNIADIGGSAPSASNPMPAQLSVGGAAATPASTGVAGNPVPVQQQPPPSGVWKSHVNISASQTTQTIHAPASGKTAYILSIEVVLSNGAGVVEIYDGTNSATTRLWAATVTWAYLTQMVAFPVPIPLSAANNVLRYDTGASVAGDIVVTGYDA